MEGKGSEFGKGLVICLVKFAEHFERYEHDRETWKKMGGISSAVEMWANGATDHLYEIEVPNGEDWDAIRQRVRDLQDEGLRIGHGFTGEDFNEGDVQSLINQTREICLLIDRKIGLSPEIGRW